MMMTLLMFLVIFVLSAMIIMLITNPRFFILSGNSSKPKGSALEQALQAKSAELGQAEEALDTAEKLVAKRKSRIEASEKDIAKLNSRIEDALANNNEGDAQRLMERLIEEEEELATNEAKYEESLERYNFYLNETDRLRRELRKAREDADEMQIEIKLAQTKTSVFDDDKLDEALRSRQSELDRHKAEVAAKHAAGEDPNAKFSDAAKKKSAADRLVEMKANMK